MRILLVSTQDYIHHPVPSRHHYIFEELARRHEVHVPHFHVSRAPERETRLQVHEATRFPVQSPLLHYTLNAPEHYRVLSRVIRDHEIEVVVAAHILAGTAVIRAARRRHVPVLFDLKDWFPDSAAAYYGNPLLKETIRRSVLAILRHNLDHSDRITTVSPGLVDKLASFGYRAGLITNGVDTSIFRPMDGAPIRERYGIAPEDFVIGFSGSVERWYAIDRMIGALPRVLEREPRALLFVVGGSLFTGYLPELRALAERLGVADRVRFAGTQPYSDLPAHIAAMDVCTIPLSPPQWIDIALPNKFFEYSACSKPILSTPIPDMQRIGGEHLHFYRDYDEFVEKILALAKTRPRYEIDMSAHDWRSKAVEFEACFESMLGR
ncbi:MAG TPA: glycosyltransferase [Methanoregulaceae archaeon]|nr:glycosyltransferase [Methanoregulaceae archaeon]HQJ88102.1 glycosyltransferase [Methanoregulaceae archaeon]